MSISNEIQSENQRVKINPARVFIFAAASHQVRAAHHSRPIAKQKPRLSHYSISPLYRSKLTQNFQAFFQTPSFLHLFHPQQPTSSSGTTVPPALNSAPKTV